jgi:hypothetical protein
MRDAAAVFRAMLAEPQPAYSRFTLVRGFYLSKQIEFKIDKVKRLQPMEALMALVLIGAAGFLTYLALDAVRHAK